MFKKTIYAIAIASLAGCAVTQSGTNQRAKEVTSVIAAQSEKKQQSMQQAQRPLYTRIHANYVGRNSASVALNIALPPAVNETAFQLPRRTNLATATKLITKLTGYPVRINPDVYISARQISPKVESTNEKQANQVAPSNLMSAQIGDFDTSLPTDFDGPLNSYLDTICGVLNINWEFDAVKGFYFYRLVTKVLEVKMNVGDNIVSTSAGKGSSASAGQNSAGGAGGTGQTTGSFTSKSTASSDANYNAWAALEASLKVIKSPLGGISVDVSTNSIVIRDTRDVVDQAEQIVNRANQVHSRMITLEVRVLHVTYDDSSAAGANVQATYNRLLSTGASKAAFTLKSPGSLVSADSGSFGWSVLSPLSPWKNSEGILQALNQLGTVVSDTTDVYVTMNRKTQAITAFDTEVYLAQTTPAAGGTGGGGSGAGVPGLTPATLTTGSFLNLTPTAFDDGNIWLDMSLDQSNKRGENATAATGNGETFQQIQLPKTTNTSKNSSVGMKPGESMILVSLKRDTMSYTNKTGIFGASGTGQHQREMQVIIVTPSVRSI